MQILFWRSKLSSQLNINSSTGSITDCINLTEGFRDSYTTFRNAENDFDRNMRLTDDLMEKHEIQSWGVSGSRRRKLPTRLENTQVESTVGTGSPVKDNPDLKILWNAILVRQIMELNTCFKLDMYGFIRVTAVCLPLSDTSGDKAQMQPVCTHFSISVEDAECTVFVQQLKRKELFITQWSTQLNWNISQDESCPEGPPHHTPDNLYSWTTLFSFQLDKHRIQGILQGHPFLWQLYQPFHCIIISHLYNKWLLSPSIAHFAAYLCTAIKHLMAWLWNISQTRRLTEEVRPETGDSSDPNQLG